MDATTLYRDQLLDRRQKLETAVAALGRPGEVSRLLQEVDAALGRMNTGTFGLCATCHDPIEPERLQSDPLTQFCLDHLTPLEQRALQHDLDLAARIQRELLPRPDVRFDGWEVSPPGPSAALAASANRQPRSTIETCVRDLAAFRGAPGANDDLTLLAIRRS